VVRATSHHFSPHNRGSGEGYFSSLLHLTTGAVVRATTHHCPCWALDVSTLCGIVPVTLVF